MDKIMNKAMNLMGRLERDVMMLKAIEIFKPNALALYCNTAYERRMVHIRKNIYKEKAPWTNDEILSKYHFCNFKREDDKCTVWIKKHIIDAEQNNIEKLMYAIIFYRYISTIEMFEYFEQFEDKLFDLSFMTKELLNCRNKGIKFNGCFIRNSRTKDGWGPIDKVPQAIINEIKSDGKLKYVIEENSFEKLTSYLCKFSGVKGFMAHQYCCDLEYSDLWNPIDKYTYATMGPGSLQGMNILLGRLRKNPLSQKEWLGHAQWLRAILQEYFNYTEKVEGNLFKVTVSMQDIQNWLCEFQKYVKYLSMEHGGNRVKHRIYIPRRN